MPNFKLARKSVPLLLPWLAPLLLAWPVVAGAQTRYLQTPEDVRKAAEGIVASVATGNPSGAWKDLKPLAVIPPAEFDVFEAQFGSQMGTILQRYGPAAGYELIREDSIGQSLIRLMYIVKHEKAPMRWLFVFYRSQKGWVVTDFKFDGNTQMLFPGGG